MDRPRIDGREKECRCVIDWVLRILFFVELLQ